MGSDSEPRSQAWEVLDLDRGPAQPFRPSAGRNRRRLLALIGVIAVAGMVAAGLATRHTAPPTAGAPAPESAGGRPGTAPAAAQVTVEETGGPLLPTSAGWDVYALGDGVLVRIDVARGRIIRTALPAPQGTGPVALVAGGGQALVRPLDDAPAYQIPDDRPAQRWKPAVGGDGGPTLPGPDSMHVWVDPGSGGGLRLVTVDGDPTPTAISVPVDLSLRNALPDGTGHVILSGDGGSYEAGPQGLRRITTGALIAVGPTRWLVHECDEVHRCVTEVVHRDDGTRRRLPGLDIASSLGPGRISPDGTIALVHLPTPLGWAPTLLDLDTGRRRYLAGITPDASPRAAAWSPDGAWLVMVDADGHLAAVDPGEARASYLGLDLPPLDQVVAVRTTR